MLAQGVRGKSGGEAAKLGSAPSGRYPSYATANRVQRIKERGRVEKREII